MKPVGPQPSTLRRRVLRGAVATAVTLAIPAVARAVEDHSAHRATPDGLVADGVELQPLVAQVRRLLAALEMLGQPLPDADLAALRAAIEHPDAESVLLVQRVLDAHSLVRVAINPEMRVSVVLGAAPPELRQAGWTSFLVKVHNQAGTTAPLRAFSPNAQSAFSFLPSPERRVPGVRHNAPEMIDAPEVGTASDAAYESDPDAERLAPLERWLDLGMHDAAPLTPALSGATLEYRILNLYSRDPGRREATLAFDVGQGTQDLGFRAETAVLFHCAPAATVRLRVHDADGMPTVAAFVIRDENGRIVPSRARRLAPDLGFQPQVYRADGETLLLAGGRYDVELRRGPESIPTRTTLVVADAVAQRTQVARFVVQRWIDVSRHGYWSGDHHIHAAGCAHYVQPTEGVRPEDMFRQTLGEDLKVGAALTWAPGFDYQKQFFSGDADAGSRTPYLLHYDIEVSGFGSHRSGHLVLLGLKSQAYAGGDSVTQWPTLGLNTLRWAKSQGATCGAAHSGFGLATNDASLPSYQVPAFDGIGANEFIVDVTHTVPGVDRRPVPAVDFLATCDSPVTWELNIWYHVLNAGFRSSIAGESDFPCIYGERVGTGRTYVRLPAAPTYRAWCDGLREGRSYVSDGRAHLMDFRVDGALAGGNELRLDRPRRVRVSVRAAALLPETPDGALSGLPWTVKPYWHVERARLAGTRSVPIEVIVNGQPVERRELQADGQVRDIAFDDIQVDRSAWLALRILPAAHTNPAFLIVGGKAIRASRRSVEWCLAGVDRCWSQKSQFIADGERADAVKAYEHARATYRTRLAECTVD